MTELIFSTVHRYPPVFNQAGEVVKIDWDKKLVISSSHVSPKSVQYIDPNPRGNSGGGRGIAIVNGQIIVAGYCELQIFDLDLQPVRIISHPLMAGLHEVRYEPGKGLWVTSTTLNTVLLIDLKSGLVIDEIWPQHIPEYQKRWHLHPMAINKSEDNRTRFLRKELFRDRSHLHFNAIEVWKGEHYGLFNRFGAVVNLDRNRIVFEDKRLFGAHNLVILEDGTIIVNDTRNQGIHLYNMQGELLKRLDLRPFHQARKMVKRYKIKAPIHRLMVEMGLIKPKIVTPFHVRGLDVQDDKLFVGISPAAILCVNWITGEFIDSFDYTNNVHIAVHGLKVNSA